MVFGSPKYLSFRRYVITIRASLLRNSFNKFFVTINRMDLDNLMYRMRISVFVLWYQWIIIQRILIWMCECRQHNHNYLISNLRKVQISLVQLQFGVITKNMQVTDMNYIWSLSCFQNDNVNFRNEKKCMSNLRFR